MLKIRPARLALLALVSFSACQPTPPGVVSDGALCRDFELQVFQPTNTRDTLAAVGATDDVFRVVNEYQRQAGHSQVGWPEIPLWVRWRGRHLGPGAYGHLIQYRHAFEVTDVLEMRVLPDSACRWARPPV